MTIEGNRSCTRSLYDTWILVGPPLYCIRYRVYHFRNRSISFEISMRTIEESCVGEKLCNYGRISCYNTVQ